MKSSVFSREWNVTEESASGGVDDVWEFRDCVDGAFWIVCMRFILDESML